MVNVSFLAVINKEIKGICGIESVNLKNISTVDAFPS